MLLTRQPSTDEVVYPSAFKRYLTNRAAVPGLSPLVDPEPFVWVVTPRPSDPTELVAVMGSDDFEEHEVPSLRTDACYTGEMVAQRLSSGSTHVLGTADAFEQYIESDAAAKAGHFFLTL